MYWYLGYFAVGGTLSRAGTITAQRVYRLCRFRIIVFLYIILFEARPRTRALLLVLRGRHAGTERRNENISPANVVFI